MMTPDPRSLLLSRGAAKSQRGRRDDPFHLALVLEGGGMRGIVSIGMASVFEDNNLFAAFDSVHGSSAGACAAAYFTTGQSHLGASIYYEDINNKSFIDLWRPSRFRPIMNVDFLIDEVMRKRKPLRTEFILNNPGLLHIVAADANSGKEVLFDRFNNEDEIYGALKGSICLPLIAGKSVNVGGRQLIDGGLVQQIAVPSAVSAGATHIIVLMTRRHSELERPVGGIRTSLEALALRSVYGGPVASSYLGRGEVINKVIGEVLSGKTGDSVLVNAIAMADDSPEVGRLTIEKDRLVAGLHAAQKAASRFLDAVVDPGC